MTPIARERWLDGALAGVLLAACEVEIVSHELGRDHRHVPLLVIAVLAAAGATAPLLWRRRAPIPTTVAEMVALVVLLVVVRNDPTTLNVPQLLLFVTPYSVAAHSERMRGLTGLGVCLTGVFLINIISPSGATSWVFSLGAVIASWAVGRFIYSQRALAAELERTADQIAAETASRERLSVAEQRTRIAQELQTLVADSVSSMVVQAQMAQRLLDNDLVTADHAMGVIEETGRTALSEMRLILGVLRRADQPVDLAPQPGIGQVSTLVDRARTGQRQVALRAEGVPGPLPASVDLGVYRILQDAIALDEHAPLEIALVFGDNSIDVGVRSTAHRLDWPTLAMRERVALCEGDLEVRSDGDGETLTVRLPRVLRGVLA